MDIKIPFAGSAISINIGPINHNFFDIAIESNLSEIIKQKFSDEICDLRLICYESENNLVGDMDIQWNISISDSIIDDHEFRMELNKILDPLNSGKKVSTLEFLGLTVRKVNDGSTWMASFSSTFAQVEEKFIHMKKKIELIKQNNNLRELGLFD